MSKIYRVKCKFHVLLINISEEENISLTFRFKKIDETRHYSLEEIKQNDLTSKKNKNVCMTLNYMKTYFF